MLAEAYDDVLTTAYDDAVKSLEEVYVCEDNAAEAKLRKKQHDDLMTHKQLHQLHQLQHSETNGIAMSSFELWRICWWIY